MKNPGDTSFTSEDIARYQSWYRCLDDWQILYFEDELPWKRGGAYRSGSAELYAKAKRAHILPCPNGVELEHYLCHEILHCALAALPTRHGKVRQAAEEILIQDLCGVIEGLRA